jgi:hypothetical protein
MLLFVIRDPKLSIGERRATLFHLDRGDDAGVSLDKANMKQSQTKV